MSCAWSARNTSPRAGHLHQLRALAGDRLLEHPPDAAGAGVLERDLALVGDHRPELGLDRDLVEPHLQQLRVLQRERVLRLRLVELRERGLHGARSFQRGRAPAAAASAVEASGQRPAATPGGAEAPRRRRARRRRRRRGDGGAARRAARAAAGAGGAGRRAAPPGSRRPPRGAPTSASGLPLGGDHQLEVVRRGRDVHRLLDRDPAGLQVLEQVLVERLHPVVGALGDDLRQLPGQLRVEDHVVDAAGHHQDLAARHAAVAVRGADEALGDDALQRAGDHRAGLLLLMGREEIDDAVDRLGGVDRVQRREHEVAGLGRATARSGPSPRRASRRRG